jgi:hypothetical protein
LNGLAVAFLHRKELLFFFSSFSSPFSLLVKRFLNVQQVSLATGNPPALTYEVEIVLVEA